MVLEIIILACVAAIIVLIARKLPNVVDFKNHFYKKGIGNSTKKETKKTKDNGSIEKLLGEADKMFSEGNYQPAEKKYIEVAALDPKNVKVYNRLGAIYSEQKNYSDAKAAFLESIKLDPKKGGAYYSLALTNISLKEYRNAIEALTKAMKFDKKNKKYQNLLQDIKKKIKNKPEDPEE